MQLNQYQEAVFKTVFGMDISPEHRADLKDTQQSSSPYVRTIERLYEQGATTHVCALCLFWQDQYNLWGQKDEWAAEDYALRQLSALQTKYKFRM